MAGEISSNLPQKPQQDSAAKTKLYFDTYGKEPLSFNAADVDRTVAFFNAKGFTSPAADLSATVLLKQAKLENISISSVLDQIAAFSNAEISALVANVLNNHRPKTSVLGYKKGNLEDQKTRNAVA